MKRGGCLLVVAALIAVPVTELAVGLLAVRHWGFGTVLLWLAAAMVAGSLVLRRLGPAARQRVRQAWQSGQPPEVTLVASLLVYAAGLLLLFPGLVSDGVAVLLLLPGVRPWLARRLLQRLSGWVVGRHRPPPGRPTPPRSGAGEIIDVTAREVKDGE